MHFEHLIQINDPLVPLLDPLSRAQLWRGLVLRAEQPMRFTMGLEGCVIHDQRSTPSGITTLVRSLNFGRFIVRDEVVLTPMISVVAKVAASDQWPASRMTITIEEPSADALFLRFAYSADESSRDAGSELDQQVEGIRRQAYVAADLDTVERIRALASSGELDA